MFTAKLENPKKRLKAPICGCHSHECEETNKFMLVSSTARSSENRVSADTCVVAAFNRRPLLWTCRVYVTDHGNYVCSGFGASLKLPFLRPRRCPMAKAFRDAGITFWRANGDPFDDRMPTEYKTLVRTATKLFLNPGENILVQQFGNP